MKKLIIIILIGIIYSACNKDYETQTVFELVNNSNHIIKINVYGVGIQSLGQDKMDTTYSLPIGFKVEYSFIEKTGKDINDNNYIEPFKNADSAIIIFDNNRQISYKPTDNNPGNILKKSNYTGGKVDKRYFKYLYSITDDDYSKAVKIK